jgi:hypothetical protein
MGSFSGISILNILFPVALMLALFCIRCRLDLNTVKQKSLFVYTRLVRTAD